MSFSEKLTINDNRDEPDLWKFSKFLECFFPLKWWYISVIWRKWQVTVIIICLGLPVVFSTEKCIVLGVFVISSNCTHCVQIHEFFNAVWIFFPSHNSYWLYTDFSISKNVNRALCTNSDFTIVSSNISSAHISHKPENKSWCIITQKVQQGLGEVDNASRDCFLDVNKKFV